MDTPKGIAYINDLNIKTTTTFGEIKNMIEEKKLKIKLVKFESEIKYDAPIPFNKKSMNKTLRNMSEEECYYQNMIYHVPKQFLTDDFLGKFKYILKKYDIENIEDFFEDEDILSRLNNIVDIESNIIDIESYIEKSIKFSYKVCKNNLEFMKLKYIAISELFDFSNASMANIYLLIRFLLKGILFFSPETKSWYMFRSHGWDKYEYESIYDFIRYVERILINISNDIAKNLTNKNKSKIDVKINTAYLSQILNLIKSNNIKIVQNDVKILIDKMTEKKLFSLFDMKNTVRFTDGIYDLDNSVFRVGYPNDFAYLKMNTRFNYPDNIKDEQIKENTEQLFKFLKSMFEDEVYEFVMTYMSSFYKFGNYDKKLVFFRGNGDNGKTKLMNLIKAVFGEYCGIPATSQLTHNRPSSSTAQPDWVNNHAKRILMYQEIGSKTTLNDSVVKMITGGEACITARELYSNVQREVKIDPKVLLSTNTSFYLPHLDNAMINRIVLVPFIYRFGDEVNEQKRIKLRDDNLEEKINGIFKIPFAKILINYYQKYISNNRKIKIPEIIKEYTSKFIEDGDDIHSFFKTEYEILDEYEDQHELKVENVYIEYSSWLKKFCNYKKIVDYKIFVDNIVEKGVIVEKDLIKNIKKKENNINDIKLY
ncbi:hypothetical protein HDV06_006566 [Boothiomyces sp. JEL0866]|nr:hypothetical protein HDV06_006566 [Boothiomyces sp. JEL0866]